MIVTLNVPGVAVESAVNETETVHVGAHGLFVNVADTPVGRPDAEKVTGVVVPVARVAVMDANWLVEPRTTVRLVGEGLERVKLNTSASVIVKLPPVNESSRGVGSVSPVVRLTMPFMV